jgi:hypothetical protein
MNWITKKNTRFFEKTSNIDKHLAKLIQRRKEKTQINKNQK